MKFKTGDRVQLSVGGPQMVVRCVLGDGKYAQIEEPYRLAGYADGDVLCEWQVRGKQAAAAYHPDQLVLAGI